MKPSTLKHYNEDNFASRQETEEKDGGRAPDSGSRAGAGT